MIPTAVAQAARIHRALHIETRALDRRITRYRGPRWASVREHLEQLRAEMTSELRAAACIVRGYLRVACARDLCSQSEIDLLRWSLHEPVRRREHGKTCAECGAVLHGQQRKRNYCGRSCRYAQRCRFRRRQRS